MAKIPPIYEVDEIKLKTAAALTGGKSNSYKKILDYGQTYREAGLTPIYYMNEQTMTIHVTTKEKMENRYH